LLDALDDSSQLLARYVNWSAHGLLLVNITVQKSDIDASASRQAEERGKQALNLQTCHLGARWPAVCPDALGIRPLRSYW
jgi:hypothetical protein